MEGTTSYVAHLVFRPLMSTDTAVLGRAASLEPIAAHCGALDVASGDEKSIGGVCVLTDSDGDKIFSIFETRDIDGLFFAGQINHAEQALAIWGKDGNQYFRHQHCANAACVRQPCARIDHHKAVVVR